MSLISIFRNVIALFLFAALAVPSFGATIAVKKDGSANATSIQAALALAASGDIVEIQDSSTYNEDVTITKTLTLRAAQGQTPVIVATNTTAARGAWAAVFPLLGAPPSTPDDYGLYVSAPNVRLEGLTIQNTPGGHNPFEFNIVVATEASGLEVIDCDLSGPVLAAIAASNLSIAGIASNDSLTVRGCTIHGCQIGVAVTDWNPTLGGPSDPIATTLIEDTEFYEIDDDAIRDEYVENLTVRDCLIRDCIGDGISLEGGNSLIENVKIVDCDGAAIVTDPDPAKGGAFITATLTDIFSCNNFYGLQAKDYNITVTNSIFANSYSGVGLDLRPWESETESVSSITINQCDLYEPAGTAIRFGEDDTYSAYDHNLSITNSILVAGGIGIDILVVPPGDGSGTVLSLDHSLIQSSEPIFALEGVSVVETAVLHDEDPEYVLADNCGEPSNFQYANYTLATAGASGQALGSQGHISSVLEYFLH